jgi:hypothetical protein
VLIASTTSLIQQGNRVVVVHNEGKDQMASSPLSLTANNQGESAKGLTGTDTVQTFPLLSMLSTDFWYDKRVIISTGPFMNRTGKVIRCK